MMEIWKALEPDGRVHGIAMESFWMHVGDPGALQEAEARLKG